MRWLVVPLALLVATASAQIFGPALYVAQPSGGYTEIQQMSPLGVFHNMNAAVQQMAPTGILVNW